MTTANDLPPPAPRRKASGGVVALGVINIVYASLFYICGGIVSIASPFFRSAFQQFVEKQGIENLELSPAMQVYSIINGVIILVLGVLFIIGGIGLLKLKPQGRRISMGVATAVIIWTVIAFVIDLFLVYPAQTQMLGEQMGQLSPGQQMVILVASRVFGTLFQLTYPIILLICLNLRSIKTQFEQE